MVTVMVRVGARVWVRVRATVSVRVRVRRSWPDPTTRPALAPALSLGRG